MGPMFPKLALHGITWEGLATLMPRCHPQSSDSIGRDVACFWDFLNLPGDSNMQPCLRTTDLVCNLCIMTCPFSRAPAHPSCLPPRGGLQPHL